MKKQEERNLVLRIIAHCIDNKKTTLNSLYKNLQLEGDEADYLRNFLINWGNESGPNHILTISHKSEDGRFYPEAMLQLLPTAVFSYIDHLEIVEARKAAKDAKQLAWLAIGISLLLGALQVYIEWST